mmetsp:Transcript_33622/g.81467  ORF Transcript_33622/g.81467 Transcript_33622/m.81467 type:complete len:242 (-) Transcript_33622:450-1175(-)
MASICWFILSSISSSRFVLTSMSSSFTMEAVNSIAPEAEGTLNSFSAKRAFASLGEAPLSWCRRDLLLDLLPSERRLPFDSPRLCLRRIRASFKSPSDTASIPGRRLLLLLPPRLALCLASLSSSSRRDLRDPLEDRFPIDFDDLLRDDDFSNEAPGLASSSLFLLALFLAFLSSRERSLRLLSLSGSLLTFLLLLLVLRLLEDKPLRRLPLARFLASLSSFRCRSAFSDSTILFKTRISD